MTIEDKVIQKYGEITADLIEVNELLYDSEKVKNKKELQSHQNKLQIQHDLLTEILKK